MVDGTLAALLLEDGGVASVAASELLVCHDGDGDNTATLRLRRRNVVKAVKACLTENGVDEGAIAVFFLEDGGARAAAAELLLYGDASDYVEMTAPALRCCVQPSDAVSFLASCMASNEPALFAMDENEPLVAQCASFVHDGRPSVEGLLRAFGALSLPVASVSTLDSDLRLTHCSFRRRDPCLGFRLWPAFADNCPAVAA